MTSSVAAARGPVRDRIPTTSCWYWEHRASCSIASHKVSVNGFSREESVEVLSLSYFSEFGSGYGDADLRNCLENFGVLTEVLGCGWVSSCQCFRGYVYSGRSWRHYDTSKRWEHFTQQLCITPQKVWIINCRLYLNIICLLSGKREIWRWKWCVSQLTDCARALVQNCDKD